VSTKTIAAGWEAYRQRVVPAGASKVQIEETRNGFYAGAWHLLSSVMAGLSDGSEPEPEDIALLDSIHAELVAFGNSKRS